MPAPQSTQPILPAASLYRTVMFCAASSIPFRLTPSYRLTAASPCPYSALFHPGMPAPQSTQPILPAASLYRTVMFCAASSIPFRLTPSYRLTAASPCPYSALFHPGMPAPQSTQPILPAASRCCNALFIQTPFNSVTAYARLPTDCRQSVPFYSTLFHSGPYCPTLLPTHTAPKPIDLVHLLQPKKTCTAHQPPLLRATPN